MIKPSTLEFLSDLGQNNYRAWFHENHDRYEAARNNVLETASEMFTAVNKFDKNIGYPDLKKCIFRIARDNRFSHNKEPYKTNFGVVLAPDGKTCGGGACYYMNIEPYDCYLSSGIYMPVASALQALRTAIDGHWNEFSAIIDDKKFRSEFGDLSREEKVLKRVPVGFDKDSPAAEYLKLTSFYIWKRIPDELVCSDRFVPEAAKLFKRMQPFHDFLNRAIRG